MTRKATEPGLGPHKAPKTERARSRKPTTGKHARKNTTGKQARRNTTGNQARRNTTGNQARLRREADGAPRNRVQLALKIAKWGAIGGLATTAVMAVVVAILFWYYGADSKLPKISKLGDYAPLQVTRISSADGKVIGEIFQERRRYVPIEEIPEHVVQAFVAAEDASFFEHSGIDYWGIVRAAFVNVKTRSKAQGASTITQQVVKTFLLSRRRAFKRKIQEIILARRLEKALNKDEILALYLNQIYFGHGRYGAEEAARYYFGKSIRDVHVGEAALLAALPKGPENYSPKKPENAGRAKSRQKYVLEQMVVNGYVEADEAKRWIDAPIEVIDEPFPHMNVAPEWVDLVRRDLVAAYGEDAIPTLGLEVSTTLDLEVQTMARDALRQGLREVDDRQGFGKPIKRLAGGKIGPYVAKLARRLPKKGPTPGGVYRAVVLEVHDAAGDAPAELMADLGDYKAAVILSGESELRFNPRKLPASERFGKGDIVRVWRNPKQELTSARAANAVELAPGPEGAVVVIDPRTRHVLAVVGGFGNRVADFNRATMARRQAGSTFKPFVFAAAVENGMTAATVINDAPEVYDLWKPENYKKGEFEGPVRLRYALAKSINTVAIRLINEVGPARVAALARAMGIESELPAHLSLALGSGEVTPLELTNAFATFAAGGIAAPPRFVTSHGTVAVAPPQPTEALRRDVAYVVTEMMTSVVTEGTAGRARKLKLSIAGKTGTTNDARDAWFVGMTPSIAIGVWVGFDDPRSLGGKESGGRTALPVFVHLVQAMGKKRLRNEPFPRPPDVVQVRIDNATGLLAPPTATADQAYDEVFIDGTQPAEVAPTENEVDVDSFVLEQYDEGGTDTAPPGLDELGLDNPTP